MQELTRKVAEMGGPRRAEIADSVQALTRRDLDWPKRVVASDPTIDALQQEIEEKAILTIARRQPMAVDLREIVAALRVANDLERIGDLAKNIGKRVVALDGDFYPQKSSFAASSTWRLWCCASSSRCSTPMPAAICRARSRSGRATRKSTPCAPRCSASC